ncbi:hypothetical protein Ark11_1324 [Candidatus Ichthyocystis hellenicum]|uniref:Uncharacterized protein n=2 Tax=Burkholderiales genera incertae sedis TaxID=224471 RepID=A0A0S4M4I8_9BURK|nr:hypothetical protein Ark11_1324 [Candidatus Ichthyocystis hellenicum]
MFTNIFALFKYIMINQFSPPCSYDYDAKIKNENQICKDPVPANINTDILLEIIKMNEIFRSINNPLTPPLIEAVPIPNCKRWESKIEIGFNQMINTFLASFADKLVEINSGSWEKKKNFYLLFLWKQDGFIRLQDLMT